jgi:hypothetical protein
LHFARRPCNLHCLLHHPGLIVAALLAWLAWLLSLPPRPSAWLVVVSGLPLAALVSWARSRRTRQAWSASVRETLDWHGLALVLLVALGVQFEDAHGVTTDGVIYFSQLRSVIFDHDLNVAAEFAFLGQPPRPYHVVPIGPTLVWLPLYLAVAAVDVVGRLLGMWSAPADPAGIGLTAPYVRAALVSSFAIGAIGLVAVHALLRHRFGRAVAAATTLLIFAATPLVWYMVYEPSMTHAASFGFVALFVAASTRWVTPAIGARHAVMLGILLGLAFITRPQEAVFALFPATLVLTAAAPPADRIRAAVRLASWALAGAALFLALQAGHSAILFSREPFSLVGADGYLDFLHSRWADTLWSSWHGFLSWTPVAYAAVIGTIAYVTRDWRWALATLGILFVMAWVNGSTADWAAGWSFGGRRFTSCLVLLAPGLAFLIDRAIARPMVVISAIAALAIAWNQLLLAQYRQDLLPAGQAVSFGQIVRQQAALATRPPFVYPFAFPANVWFAWRTGLPIDRYDLLAPEAPRASLDLRFDGEATRFLLAGWGARAAEPSGELRWIEQPRAELVVPLDLPPGDVRVEIVARTRLLDPPVQVGLVLRVNGHDIGRFVPDAANPSRATFTVPANAGAWRRGFNRIVFEKAPGDVQAPPVAIYRLVIAP